MEGKSEEILPFFPFFPNTVTLDALQISALLMHKRWKEAHELLDTYPPEILGDEYSPLFVPMGCYLAKEEGEEIARLHFGGSIDLPHPPTTMLLSDYLRGKITEKKGWSTQAFAWEKITLLRQLFLYYHCTKKTAKAEASLKKLKKQLKKLSTSSTPASR
jgi:serine/threonine-protein kinase